ncbi:MAG TPA: HD domain-containing phosphohydrolase [Candidatus Sulfotelmatobacter sp.]|nr:HD domain-containing phosphohydrolase [Candidatus Sulfotelmatobacter sp.]
MGIGEKVSPLALPLGESDQADALKRLVELGIALSAERNHDRLLERIMVGAMELSNADGGTLYLRTDDDRLRFEIIRNQSLGIAMGGTTGQQVPFPSLVMFKDQAGKVPNHSHVATHVALSGATSKIDDAYTAADFDFSGTRNFDEGTGYRSKSFLTVPLKNRQQAVIGVLQLLNAIEPASGKVIPFADSVVPLIEALSSQAAVALDNQRLIDEQRNLFDAFINLMAGAIDAKSAYTGGHCQRVPVLTEMLAEAACQAADGPFADFNLTDDQWYELRVAGGLHDVGKVTTPTHVMDKATKLEKIYDRIEEVRVRAEVIRRDIVIAYLEGVAAGKDPAIAAAERDRALAQLSADVQAIAHGNIGGEFMSDAAIAELAAIAKRRWTLEGTERPLLSEEELMNLSIRRGTLNDAERKIINDHIVLTIQMLEQLPFPSHMRNVPELAGGHHEKMDGTGYPKRLKRHEMSLPARMMGVADIFEALTAADRPYKKPKSLSESMRIMLAMRDSQHIDPDIFRLFVTSGVYRRYAEKFLLPEQIDEVDEATLLA